MLVIYIIFTITRARLQILSPIELSALDIPFAVSKFGDPYLYEHVGKLIPIQKALGCSIPSDIYLTNNYALLYGFDSCYFSSLALSVQNAGGIGMIFVNPLDDLNFLLSANDSTTVSQVNITCIAIRNSSGSLLKEYSSTNIWFLTDIKQPEIPGLLLTSR